ncbi:MAG: selenide, water dikinase SelD, partial [Candidatus Desulforudis sp.]|nr:selenide, water dikinase SelD [Desulforudis sp.]
DILLLTKPLGTGIITTAMDRGIADHSAGEEAVEVMAALNKAAGLAMTAVGVSACVDVTGFGLIGHLHELSVASGVAAYLDYHAIPVLTGAEDLVQAGAVSAGTQRNALHFGPYTEWKGRFAKAQQVILADAQTSGGLLMSVQREKTDSLLWELAQRGAHGHIIGEVGPGKPGSIVVRP